MSTTKIFAKIFLYVGSNNPETFQFVCLMKNIPTVLSRISDYPLLIKKKKGHLQIFVFKKKKTWLPMPDWRWPALEHKREAFIAQTAICMFILRSS